MNRIRRGFSQLREEAGIKSSEWLGGWGGREGGGWDLA
jgi:hypothetical protein